MLLGILRMPADSIAGDYAEMMQFVSAAHAAADRIEADAKVIAELRAALEAAAADKRDAERWRQLESDGVVDIAADAVSYQTKLVKKSINEWNVTDMYATATMKSKKVPIREIRIRWLDEDNDRRTLKQMIDGVIFQRQGEGS